MKPAVRVAAAVAILAAVIGTSATIVLKIGEQASAALPPIMPMAGAPFATVDAPILIPEGFLPAEARATQPLQQEGVRWVRTDEPNLPPLVSPCGGFLPSDAERVAGRQVALVAPTLWKLARLVVYRDTDAARRAMAERRTALQGCARHDEGDGTATVWTWEPLQIGEEAMFVGGQRYRGAEATHGHQRGVLMRQGRTVVMYVDFGQAVTPPGPAEVERYEDEARVMAIKLASAPWN